MSAEIITIPLDASGTPRFERSGLYFEVIESSAPFSVDLYGRAGNLSDTLTAIESGFFVENDFTAFVIRNGAAAQTIKVLVMDKRRGGTRRQPGVVSVVDKSAAKTSAGGQHWVGYTRGAIAGQYSACGLRAVGKRVAVRRITISSGVAGVVTVGKFTGGTSLPDAGACPSKLIGGSGSSAQLSIGTTTAYPPTSPQVDGYQALADVMVASGVPTVVDLEVPVILPAGVGLVAISQAANRDVSVIVDFEEGV